MKERRDDEFCVGAIFAFIAEAGMNTGLADRMTFLICLQVRGQGQAVT